MKYKNLTSGFILFFLQVIVLFYVFRFLYPFKEQFQMFQFTGQYAAATWKQAGGVALYLSEFLSQFYIIIGIGPVITAFLLTLVAIVSSLILKKISIRNDLPVVFFLPWLSLLIMHLDYDYLEQGTIAYLFLLLFLWIYVNLSPRIRLVYGLCIIPLLYLIAGPITHLFAVSAFLFEFLINGTKKYICIIYLPVAVISAVAGCYSGYSPNIVMAFLPDAYYNPQVHNSQICYSWYALPAAMLLAAFLKKYNSPVSFKGKCRWVGFQWAIIFLLGYESIIHFGKIDALDQFQQDYYVRTGQWDKIIAGFDQTVLSKRRMCNLNLALAQTGQLSERLFDYPQGGIETLMLRWDQSVFTAELHSDLYYCMGIISTSRKFAFEALVSSRPSGNPRMLKRLVETNIITGAYPVAEKYIRLLENTWHYKEWASSYRRFLQNDRAVEQDPVLGLKRRCWKAEAAIPELYTDPVSTLTHLVPACPDNKSGLQYLTSFLLLNKDIGTYMVLQESLFRTPAWPEMTDSQQEAVVICRPDDLHFWLEHGVSVKVRNQALAFMQKVKEGTRFGQNPAVVLAPEYGKTYWFYYMFNTMDK
ncbi:hypothetical protein DWX23_15795 [Parabacteroides sp. AF18-52]|uniref:DUF6057 family protein n=2 Tax=Parabacteroides TaxID=375288 RepID=UPI000EFDFDE8|nr:DUF6057 family protein [Parabacteroides sp. AF18-52]RHR38083.1 hypothetical protein DWX23_15795 [Parabacteroides sp. AF18-52]